MKGKGNLSLWYAKKGPKGLTDEFYGYKKSRKPSGFGIDSYLKDGTWGKGYHLSMEVIQKRYLFHEKSFIEG